MSIVGREAGWLPCIALGMVAPPTMRGRWLFIGGELASIVGREVGWVPCNASGIVVWQREGQ